MSTEQPPGWKGHKSTCLAEQVSKAGTINPRLRESATTLNLELLTPVWPSQLFSAYTYVPHLMSATGQLNQTGCQYLFRLRRESCG